MKTRHFWKYDNKQGQTVRKTALGTKRDIYRDRHTERQTVKRKSTDT